MTQKKMILKIWWLLTCLIAINISISSSSYATSHPINTTMSLPPIEAFEPIIDDLKKRFPKSPISPLIIISASEQKLFLIEDNKVTEAHLISTGLAGLGNKSGSNKTPLGVHKITQKFGKYAKLGTIFKARMNTKRVARILTDPEARSTADNVTSRILWLSGMEKGINKGGNVDSHSRYIYIHGTDEEGRLGKPASHGCIRMNNKAVINLFSKVPLGTIVDILE